jgi:hypothetical protein
VVMAVMVVVTVMQFPVTELAIMNLPQWKETVLLSAQLDRLKEHTPTPQIPVPQPRQLLAVALLVLVLVVVPSALLATPALLDAHPATVVLAAGVLQQPVVVVVASAVVDVSLD